LKSKRFKFDKITRLPNKNKNGPEIPVKIQFTDTNNTDLLIKTGLQFDDIHFPDECAQINTQPQQCHICLDIGHIAKYCTKQQKICSKCSGQDKVLGCDKTYDEIKHHNCESPHLATSDQYVKYTTTKN
ncbi:unnamed protein product, partial [Didymodactylos carnosus]